MKVSTSELPPRQVVLDIEVEQDQFDKAMEQAFRRVANRVNVPGFRKGKAPRSLVERTVGRQAIVEDAIEHLSPTVVSEAMESEKVTPFLRPSLEIVEVEPLRLKVTVPLEPKVELGKYQEIRVPRETAAVEAARVDEMIDRLRDAHAQWVPVQRPAQEGDRVGLDVKGTVEAEGEEEPRVLIDSKDAEYLIDPEGPQPVPGFHQEILGLNEGEDKTFSLPLPDDFRDPSLAGKAVQFQVHLHWVKEKELPELDETFAQQVGDFEDVGAVRKAIEDDLRKREEERLREAHEDAVLDKLVETSTIEVPPQLVERQAEQMIGNFAQTMERQGIQLARYLQAIGKDQNAFVEEMRERALKMVQSSLALEILAEKEGLQADEGAEEAVEPGHEGHDHSNGRLLRQKALERLIEIAAGGEAAPKKKTSKLSRSKEAASDTPEESKAKASS